jgi:hypothetical protein
MNILIGLILGSAWAFYEALVIDRPDLAAIIHEPYGTIIHIAFAVFFLALTFVLSFQEMRRSKSWWINGPKIYLRNAVVIGLGVVLLVVMSRWLLDGIDHTGHRALW